MRQSWLNHAGRWPCSCARPSPRYHTPTLPAALAHYAAPIGKYGPCSPISVPRRLSVTPWCAATKRSVGSSGDSGQDAAPQQPPKAPTRRRRSAAKIAAAPAAPQQLPASTPPPAVAANNSKKQPSTGPDLIAAVEEHQRLVRQWAAAYYNGSPLVSDDVYDQYVAELAGLEGLLREKLPGDERAKALLAGTPLRAVVRCL